MGIKYAVAVDSPGEKQNQIIIQELEDDKIFLGGTASPAFLLASLKAIVDLKNSLRKGEEPYLCVITAFRG